jgi:hypothetical protein
MKSPASLLVVVTGVYLMAATGCDNPPVTGATPGKGGSGGSTGGGSGGSGPGPGPGGGGAGNAGASGGSMGSGGTGGPGFTPPPRVDGGAAPPTGPGPGSEGAACATSTAKGEPVPVDIHIMFDKSGSMLGPKWDAARAALTAFVRAPTTAGLNVGMAMFPIVRGLGGILGLSSCDIAEYARPVVPVGALPGVAMNVVNVLNMTQPSGGTPTKPALQGAIQYARTWEMTMGRRIVVLLVTDGVPNECDSTVMSVSMIAQAAASTGILTFVVGVGPNLQSLNDIAVAGGTGMAYLVDGGNPDQLIDALKKVQTQASRLACSFKIPPPRAGEMLDPTKVNVRFSPDGNPMTAMTLPQVMNRAACGPMGGWFYDNPTNPTTVNLCDASCMRANQSPMGEVSLQFGCKTEVIQ